MFEFYKVIYLPILPILPALTPRFMALVRRSGLKPPLLLVGEKSGRPEPRGASVPG
jgi:hypothetical protein